MLQNFLIKKQLFPPKKETNLASPGWFFYEFMFFSKTPKFRAWASLFKTAATAPVMVERHQNPTSLS